MTGKVWTKRLLSCTLAIAMVFSTAPVAFAGTAAADSGATAVIAEEDGIVVNGGNPVQIIEGQDCETVWGDNDNTYLEYNLRSLVRNYTVTIDGETYQSDSVGEIWYGEDWHIPQFTSNQDSVHWTLGNTYEATISILGMEAVFQVEIVESPVDDIIINGGEPLEIIQYTNGCWETDEQGNDYFSYNLGCMGRSYEVIIDGESYAPDKESEENGIRYNGRWYYPEYSFEPGQYTNHWTTGNTYTAEFTLLGKTVPYQIKIVDTPVDEVVVNNGNIVEICENTNGEWYEEDESGGYYHYNLIETCEPFTVTIDGQTYESDGDGSVYYNGSWQWASVRSQVRQSEEHWTVGNTYDVTMYILGKAVEYQVKIVSSPVEEIVVNGNETKVVYEGVDGYWTEEEGEEGSGVYFRYYTSHMWDSYTVTIGGETYESDEEGYITYNGKRFYPQVEPEVSQYDEPWAVGNTYNVKMSILGKTTLFQVQTAALPIDEIIINGGEVNQMMENTSGDWYELDNGEQYFRYYNSATLDSLTVIIGGEEYNMEEGSIYYNGSWIEPTIDTHQSEENRWTVGNTYDCTLKILGQEVPYQVEIVGTPVEDIVVNGGEVIEIIENTSGNWDWGDSDDDEYFRYSSYDLVNSYTVTIDGEEYESDEENMIRYDGEWYSAEIQTDQNREHWVAGNTYDATLVVMGKRASFQVKIIPSPVKSIKVKDKKFLEGTGGHYVEDDEEDGYGKWYKYDINAYTTPFTVELHDGTIINSDGEGSVKYNGKWYYASIETDQRGYNAWGAGEHEATISVLGQKQTFKVTILCDEHDWDEGTITEEATCMSKGEVTYTCLDCGETKTALTPKGDHSWNEDFTVDKAATCTEAGSKSIHCANCKATKDETAIPVKAHKEIEFGAKEATCTAAGMSAGKMCAVCDKVIAEPQPENAKGHTPGKAATCTTSQNCVVCHAMLKAPTGHVAGPEATCKTAQNCAICGEELEEVKGHAVAMKEKVNATLDDSGEIVESCICGSVMSTVTISKIKTVKLAKTTYTYTGKAMKPAVTVEDAEGNVIDAAYYTVTYKNNTKVGKATVTVKFKGNYSGTKTLTFNINPKAPTVKKPVAAKKAVTAKWSKVTKEVSGYEVMVATNKNFTSGKKTVTIKKAGTTSAKVTKLKAKKTYYVKVRAYKTVGKVKYYSAWSSVKTVKTK